MKRAIGALVAVAAAAALPAPAAGTAPVARLPDLVQSIPRDLQVQTVDTPSGPDYRLGFTSAVHNDGTGPLIVQGHRPDSSTPDMTADQVAMRADGTSTTYPAIGRLHYVYDVTHNHWHFLDFEHYELRRASDDKLVSPDAKTGFCLTDDATGDHPLPGQPASPVFTDRCGLSRPDLLDVTEGISVGWTDIYDPLREGQYVELTGALSGRYFLVHRTNPARRIRESSYANDVASLLVDVEWPGGTGAAPTVRTLKSCFDSAICLDKPVHLTRARAAGYARTAVLRTLGRRTHGVSSSCRLRGRNAATCSASAHKGSSSYSGTVRLASTLLGGAPFVRYTATLSATGSKSSAHGELPEKL